MSILKYIGGKNLAKKVTRETIARAKRIRQIRKDRLKQELEELNEVRNSSKRTKIISLIFVFAVMIGFLIYVINVEGIEKIKEVLENADYKWLLLGVIIVIAEWIFEAIAIHIPLKKMYPRHKFLISLKSNIIGRLFNNITPFSSGGQPFQAYILAKKGLRASDTFSALMMRFVIYQVSIFSWALILLVINFQFFNETFKDYIWLIVLGFIMNLIATLFILIAGINKKIILKISNILIRLIAKIRIGKHHFIKDVEATLEKADNSISNYSNQFNKMKNNGLTIVKMYVVVMLQLFAYFSIPFMIYKAFGNSGISYFEILTVQTFLLIVMSFIPTPGSGLGAEGGFALLYSTVFLKGLNMGILFWRIYTYYLPIIVGVFVLVFMNRKETNKIIKAEFTNKY